VLVETGTLNVSLSRTVQVNRGVVVVGSVRKWLEPNSVPGSTIWISTGVRSGGIFENAVYLPISIYRVEVGLLETA